MNNVVRLVSLADRARRWTLRGVSMTLAHLASLPPIDASRFPNNHPSYAPVGSLVKKLAPLGAAAGDGSAAAGAESETFDHAFDDAKFGTVR